MLAVLFCVQIEQGTGDQVIQTLHQPEARLLVQQKKNQQSEWSLSILGTCTCTCMYSMWCTSKSYSRIGSEYVLYAV